MFFSFNFELYEPCNTSDQVLERLIDRRSGSEEVALFAYIS